MAAKIRRLTAGIDRLQRRYAFTAVVVGVTKRYGEDRAGNLIALITFYGFLSVFPLLLLLLTLVGLFFSGSTLQHDIVHSALSQFPVIGDQLGANVHAISRSNPLAIVASILGLTWGSLGVTSSMQHATHRIWRLPLEAAPGLLPRTLKGIQLLGALLLIVVLSSVAAGASTIGTQYFGGGSVIPRALALIAALVVNLVGYFLVLWILSPRTTALRSLVPGIVLGAFGWTLLQALSGYLLGHKFHHASQIYGVFAIVLGLIFWINLGAQLFMYSSELNLVLLRHEWPRYVFGEPDEAVSATT